MLNSRLLLLGLPATAVAYALPASGQPQDDGANTSNVAVVSDALRPLAGEEATAPPPPPPEAEEERERPGIFQDYTGYWDWKFEELLSKPLWGNTTALPAGIFKFRYEYTHAMGHTYFDGDGNEVPLLPPLTFNDVLNPGDTLLVDPRLKGEGGEHNFQFGYGITDIWDVFVEMPFTQAKTEMDLRFAYNGQVLGPNDIVRRAFSNSIIANGRPLPNSEWETPVSLGDMRVGTSVNYWRTEYFSAAITPSMFLPTGHQADPNNDITFLLGPEIDRGVGAFATNITSVFDLRPAEWLIFSFEVQATYQFGYDRDAPKWLPITDCRRLPDGDPRRAQRCTTASPAYDRAYDLEQGATFPDLENLGDTYHVESLLSTGFVGAITLELTPLPIQFGYQFDRTEAPKIRAEGPEETALAFEQMVKSLQLLEASEVHSVAIGTSIPLFPLYIPISLQPKAKWMVAGKNVMRLRQQYSIAAELYLPVNDFFD